MNKSNLTIFGINISDLSFQETFDQIVTWCKGVEEHKMVVTANPEILLYARQSEKYRKIIAGADLVTPDGMGVILASIINTTPLFKGRVRGFDLVNKLINDSTTCGYSVYLLGGSKIVATELIKKFGQDKAKFNVIGIESGLFFEYEEVDNLLTNKLNNDIINNINNKKPDVLLVAFGHPKQEMWLSKFLPLLRVKVGIGVGGSFDYLVGKAKLPPRWFKLIGLEWLWRLICQPSRFLRIFRAVVLFPFFVLKDHFVPRGTK